MNHGNVLRAAALCCSLALLAGCAAFQTADDSLATASRQVATEDTVLTGASTSAPKAKITPQGDFLVAGKPVALTARQRDAVIAYRTQYVDIAERGIAIAQQGVDAGRRAVVPIVFDALIGESDQKVAAKMNARLANVYAGSLQLCNRLPALMAAQQRLTASLPAFKPYATLTPQKIEECRRDAARNLDAGAQPRVSHG